MYDLKYAFEMALIWNVTQTFHDFIFIHKYFYIKVVQNYLYLLIWNTGRDSLIFGSPNGQTHMVYKELQRKWQVCIKMDKRYEPAVQRRDKPRGQ